MSNVCAMLNDKNLFFSNMSKCFYFIRQFQKNQYFASISDNVDMDIFENFIF